MEKPKGIQLCNVEGCNRKHVAKGFCAKHYQKNRLNSNPEARKKHIQYIKQYNLRPEIKEKNQIKRKTEYLSKRIRDLCEKDPHEVCKKLGKPINHMHADKHYFLRCSTCNVSFSDLHSELLFKDKRCPCCHRLLRKRLGITRKKKSSDIQRL